MIHIRLVRFGVLLLCLFSFFAYALPKTAYAATDTVKAVSTSSGGSTCAIMTDGSLKCWGNNSSGQLGYDDTVNRGGNTGDLGRLSAVNLGLGRTVTAVSVGDYHTCAILENGKLKCWGFNLYGQLGYDQYGVNLGANPGDMAALGYVDLGVGRTAVFVCNSNHVYSCVRVS
jgi:alpha-tubulin suppressor-like RCC1 family protein